MRLIEKTNISRERIVRVENTTDSSIKVISFTLLGFALPFCLFDLRGFELCFGFVLLLNCVSLLQSFLYSGFLLFSSQLCAMLSLARLTLFRNSWLFALSLLIFLLLFILLLFLLSVASSATLTCLDCLLRFLLFWN
jgi:hypothetical protein